MSMDFDGTLFCNFCSRSKDECEILIVSPHVHPLEEVDRAHICNDCVAVAVMIITERRTIRVERPESIDGSPEAVSPTQKETQTDG